MENEINEPIIEEKSSISFVWLLPIIILAVLGWTVYESYNKKGTNITVTFNSAEGLKEGITPLKYRGLELGKVTKIDIKDLDKVEVNILVKKEAAKYVAKKGSNFWIKKPTITLTKITGLNTLISGYEIEFMPDKDIEKNLNANDGKTDFKGLNSQPEYQYVKGGYYITLLAKNGDKVNNEMPLFYNSFQIGEIVSKELKNSNVYLKAYIYKKYENLVNESSNFVLNDALHVTFGAGGFSLKVSSLYSALIGGITISTPLLDAKKITEEKHYHLYTTSDNLEEKIAIDISFLNAEGIGVDTPILYKGINIGKITNISLKKNSVKANAYVFKKYKYLLTNNSDFFINEPEISLDGIKNIGTVFTGKYVTLNYKKGDFQTSFKDKNLSQKDNVNDLEITLKANSLGSVTKKSKIYFKNIEIGKITDISLAKDFKSVIIKTLIYDRYKKLINKNSIFYDMSSKLIDIKNLNMSINYSGIDSLLKGSIALIADKSSKNSKKSFKLYKSYQEAYKIKKLRNEGFLLNAAFENSFTLKKDMPVFYENQEIGFVNDIKFEEYYSKANLFIYNKFKKYIDKKSRFYKKSPLKIDASLNGILFEIGDISSLLNGSIYLDKTSIKKLQGYQIYESYDKMKSNSDVISIVFDNDVEGLIEQSSKLIYKGIDVGKVIDISLSKNQKIVVKVQIYKDFKSFAKQGNQYYLKKSKISLQEVKNLSSAIFAVNLGVVKNSSKKMQRSFKGYDSISKVRDSSIGKIYKVVSSHATSAGVDSPIYYKNVQIGKINSVDLSSDASKVVLDCLIYDKYTHIIRKNSNFYDISGFKLKFSLFSGTEVKTNTITSILKGGLMVITPKKYEEKADSKKEFILKKELMDDWEKISPIIK
jgi:paraquat-inducible protein B